MIELKDMSDSAMLTVTEVAKIFGVTPVSINNWTKQGNFANPVLIGRRKLYSAASIKAFMNQKIHDAQRTPYKPRTRRAKNALPTEE